MNEAWRIVESSGLTTYIHPDDLFFNKDNLVFREQLVYRRRKASISGSTIDIIPILQSGQTISRVSVAHTQPDKHVFCYYRTKLHEYRMMLMVVEQVTTKDFLRHIYQFVRK